MSKTTSKVFVVRNWKYFQDRTNTACFSRESYAHPAFQMLVGFDGEVFPTVPVDGIGDVPVKRVYRWDMGDGTIIEGETATHVYKKAGKFTIKCTFIDNTDSPIENTFSAEIKVYDFAQTRVEIDAVLTTVYASEATPFTVQTMISTDNIAHFRNKGFVKVDLSYDGRANSKFRYLTAAERASDGFSHLLPSIKFMLIDATSFAYVDSVNVPLEEGYFKFDANLDVVLTTVKSEAFDTNPVALIGTKKVFFSIDRVCGPGTIWAAFDPTEFGETAGVSAVKEGLGSAAVQTFNMFASGREINSVIAPPTTGMILTLTSNGFDGEGSYTTSAFSIDKNKFLRKMSDGTRGAPFSLVAKFKRITVNGSEVFLSSSLFLPRFTLTKDNITLLDVNENPVVDGDSKYDIVYDSPLYQDEMNGGFSKVIIKFKEAFPNGVKLLVSASTDGVSAISISNVIYIWPETGAATVLKKNESFSTATAIADYRTQKILLNSERIFDELIPNMLGETTGSAHKLGNRLYEKTTNLIENRHDIDFMEASAVSDRHAFFDGDVDGIISKLPGDIRHTIDVYSTQISNLYGSKPVTENDFNTKGNDIGFTLSGIAKNKGAKLDFNTHIITPVAVSGKVVADSKIVAYEKFSESYIILNCNRIDQKDGKTLLASPFPLASAFVSTGSGYRISKELNWPLVLPANFVPSDIPKYYDFFEYVEVSAGTHEGGMVEFTDGVTLDESHKSLEANRALIESSISRDIASGLGLLG